MRKLIYPITVFVALQLVVLTSITLWVIWFVLNKKEYEGVAALARTAYSSFESNRIGYASMVSGLLLLFAILVGSTYLFIGWVRERLIHRQRATFFSGFTHELMTPITCIQMNLETLMKHELDKEKKDQLMSAAYKEGKRLQSAINNILEMTRIEHKKKTIQPELIDFSQYLATYVRATQELYPELEIEQKASETCMVSLDTKAFELVLNNLVENAIKYGSQPKISLSLSVTKKKVTLTFSDNGPGTTLDEKKLFKIFYRGNNKVQGTGLGLFIVKSIVELHKGKVELAKTTTGTTFMIHLPLRSSHE